MTHETCPCCWKTFGEGRRCITLPCDDRVCECCVRDAMTQSRSKKCPKCFAVFESFTPSNTRKHIAPKYPPKLCATMSTCSERDERSNLAAQNFSKRSSFHSYGCSPKNKRSSKLDGFLRNHLDTCNESIANCQTTLSLIDTAAQGNTEMKKTLAQCNKKLEAIIEECTRLQQTNKSRIKTLDKDNVWMKGHRCDIEVKLRRIKSFREKLNLVNKFQDAVNLTDQDPHVEVAAHLKDIQNWLKRDESRRERFQKVCDGVADRVGFAGKYFRLHDGDSSEEDEEGHMNPYGGVTAAGSYANTPNEITVTDLRKMNQITKCHVLKENVFATQNFRGRRRFAKLFISESGHMMLGHLQDLELPPDALVVEYSEIMGLQRPYPQQVFFEVSNAKTSLGLVHISLLPENMRARHFVLLCIGEMGPSYTGTKFLEVAAKGHEKLELLRCGDYENNNGTGGKSLIAFTHEEADNQQTSALAGTLTGIGKGEDLMLGQFWIYMRHDTERKNNTTFGKVESGLNILHQAIGQHKNISEVFIKESGVVLWKIERY
ncbi:uncharacterized protein [Palaemon carinicauda]